VTGVEDTGPVVLARELAKSYGERVAVAGIDFQVPAGVCFGFLGPNGAGKTTTMKMIYGLATVGDGELRVLGMDARRERRQIKARIGVVPQETNLDGDLTVRENLIQQANYFGVSPEKAAPRADELLEFALIRDRADERIHALSGGMKRRLLIARALVNDPELIVLDEPTTGLDPQARLAVWRALELDLAEECDPDALLESLGERANGHEFHDGALTLFADDAEELLRSLDHERFPTETAMVRRATLEDVFLRLTGRSLREGE
jgi:ABC-type multidrug transport system ATPase subunit